MSIVDILHSQYNYDLLALLWKLSLCNKEGQCIRDSINEILPNFKQVIEDYDEEGFYSTRGTVNKKLHYFIARKDIPRIKLAIAAFPDATLNMFIHHSALKTCNPIIARLCKVPIEKYTHYLYSQAAKRGHLPWWNIGRDDSLDSLLEGNTPVLDLDHLDVALIIALYTFNKPALVQLFEYRIESVLCKYHVDIVCMKHGMELLEWLNENYGITPNQCGLAKAAMKGNIKLLQRWVEILPNHIINEAIISGSLELVIWLHSKGFYLTFNIVSHTIERGHLHILKWIHTQGIPVTQMAIKRAMQRNRADIFIWLCEQGIVPKIVRSYNTQILNYSVEHEFNIDFEYIEHSPMNGTDEGLKWLISKGHTLPNNIIKYVISSGDTSMLQWAVDYGFSINEDDWISAVKNRDLSTLQWAHKRGYKFPSTITNHCYNNIVNDWLKSVGY